MLMFKNDGGYHNFGDHEVAEAQSAGWVVISDDDRRRIIEAKRNGMPSFLVADTITPQPVKRAGRPRKMPSFLGVADGNSPDDN